MKKVISIVINRKLFDEMSINYWQMKQLLQVPKNRKNIIQIFNFNGPLDAVRKKLKTINNLLTIV